MSNEGVSASELLPNISEEDTGRARTKAAFAAIMGHVVGQYGYAMQDSSPW